MLILGSMILVSQGNQGCAQKLHKKVKLKNIYLLCANPDGRIIQMLGYGDHETVNQFFLNSWHLIGGLCPRVGAIGYSDNK